MDALTIFTLALAVIGGVAAIIQILDYIEKKRSIAPRIIIPSPLISTTPLSTIPVVQALRGRDKEIEQLVSWAKNKETRLIGISGIGGIGKTSLVALVTHRLVKDFDSIVWYSMVNAPSFEEFLRETIFVISKQSITSLPDSLEQKNQLLMNLLHQYRSLIILDNMESVLKTGEQAGHFREGFEAYGVIMQNLTESEHRSCVIITSREKPRSFAMSRPKKNALQFLLLPGLADSSTIGFLQDLNLKGSESDFKDLNRRYSGNPLALKLISEYISSIFSGSVRNFLREGEFAVGDIKTLIEEQLKRASELERRVIDWLAIEREGVTLDTLQQDLLGFESKEQILEALVSLQRRHLVESHVEDQQAYFYLQPVILEYVSDKLIKGLAEEIMTEQYELFVSYSLVKAQSKAYVRESQQRMLLTPLTTVLTHHLGFEGIKKKCLDVLRLKKGLPLRLSGYAPGNAINILMTIGVDLTALDLSNLIIRQVCFQGVNLHDVNFANSDLSTSTFTDTFGGVLSTACSPDGKLVAAGTTDGSVRVWREFDGELVYICEGHTDWVWSVTFSPDSRFLVSSSGDRTVRIWDVQTSECLKILIGHTDGVKTVVFSRDGSLIASGAGDQTVRIWNAVTFELEGVVDLDNKVICVVFHPTQYMLAIGTLSGKVYLWDVLHKNIIKELVEHTTSVTSIAFNHDGSLLATGSEDYTILVRSFPQTDHQINLQMANLLTIDALVFSPNGEILASGSRDCNIRYWNTKSWTCQKTLQGHRNPIRGLSFNVGGTVLYSASQDRSLRSWDTSDGRMLRVVQGYSSIIWSVSFHPDKHHLLCSGGSDKVVRLWNLDEGAQKFAFAGHTNEVREVSYSPDGNLIASASTDMSVRIWDANSNTVKQVLKGHTRGVTSLVFSPTHMVASIGSDHVIRLWDVNTGNCVNVLSADQEVRACIFIDERTMLISGAVDQNIQIWDVLESQYIGSIRVDNPRPRPIAFCNTRAILAIGDVDSSIRLLSYKSSQLVATLQGSESWVGSMTFNSSGELFASGGGDWKVRVWDLNTYNLLAVLSGHTGPIRSVKFSPDSKYIASSSDDGTVRIWNAKFMACETILRANRLYERMNISNVQGLSSAQQSLLYELGATAHDVTSTKAVHQSSTKATSQERRKSGKRRR